jgi:hypothetical protein
VVVPDEWRDRLLCLKWQKRLTQRDMEVVVALRGLRELALSDVAVCPAFCR